MVAWGAHFWTRLLAPLLDPRSRACQHGGTGMVCTAMPTRTRINTACTAPHAGLQHMQDAANIM